MNADWVRVLVTDVLSVLDASLHSVVLLHGRRRPTKDQTALLEGAPQRETRQIYLVGCKTSVAVHPGR